MCVCGDIHMKYVMLNEMFVDISVSDNDCKLETDHVVSHSMYVEEGVDSVYAYSPAFPHGRVSCVHIDVASVSSM